MCIALAVCLSYSKENVNTKITAQIDWSVRLAQMMYNKLMANLNPATDRQKRYIIALLKQCGLGTASITPAHRALGAPAQATSVNDWLDHHTSIEEADRLIRQLKAMPRQQLSLFPLPPPITCPCCGRPLRRSAVPKQAI